MIRFGFSVDLPSDLRFFCQRFFIARTANWDVSVHPHPARIVIEPTMMASEDPMVEVPIVFASSCDGALKSLAIMETHPVALSQPSFQSLNLIYTYGSEYRR